VSAAGLRRTCYFRTLFSLPSPGHPVMLASQTTTLMFSVVEWTVEIRTFYTSKLTDYLDSEFSCYKGTIFQCSVAPSRSDCTWHGHVSTQIVKPSYLPQSNLTRSRNHLSLSSLACARRTPTMQVTLHDFISHNHDGNRNVHMTSFSEITNPHRCAFVNSRVV
jgi:hypothetical protein